MLHNAKPNACKSKRERETEKVNDAKRKHKIPAAFFFLFLFITWTNHIGFCSKESLFKAKIQRQFIIFDTVCQQGKQFFPSFSFSFSGKTRLSEVTFNQTLKKNMKKFKKKWPKKLNKN